MFKSISIATLALAFVAGLGLDGSALAGWKHRAQAKLFGPGMKGHARYEERPKNGTTLKRFKVEIENALPLQTFEIVVNGSLVGSITTNGFGFGKFQLRTAQFIDSPGDGLPMPPGFPKLDTGDIVEVGSVSGTFFDKKFSKMQDMKLRSDFGDDDFAAAGHVKYRERFKNGCGLERRFEVEVENASSGETFDILVNGQLVGTLVADDDETEFELRTAAFIDSPGDGQPMPSSFPSLHVGDIVQVGPFTVTLELD